MNGQVEREDAYAAYDVGVGESRPILRIGGSDKVRTHLENLGFVEGETVRVVSDIGGNLIVQVKDARVGPSAAIGDQDSGLSSIGAESEHTGGG